ncbi:ABC transporter permease [Lactococcus piscium]|uniref:FtsX-like permease family protein n=1 Tax=Pseudolactococcus carnosus TaxID=2749961 RepID=UPI001FBC0571|nr:FtsX-like permease family protein [Lactococcus carnosus]MCJ1995499.1 ABC transporter permease [Lactococcus carnosus]
MMFYIKLAARNFKKSLSNFAPFLLATTVMFAMTFIIANIAFSPGLDKLTGAEYARFMMIAGLVIVVFFSIIIVSYSYRFLLKQRTREFGLYNILGLNKRQISTISFWELVIAFFFTVITGTIVGLILSQFLFLIFTKIIGATYFNLGISVIAIGLSVLTFFIIFCLLMVFAFLTILKHSAISLLEDSSRSEREPRGRIIVSILSILCLGTAYYMAITIKNPLVALMSFFIAALLVIIGTYCLYMGVTIFVLKRQKANKAYYYKPEHFITTSSMLYRMKTNAVGLANITILVTMTFVTIATSVALYVGVQEVITDLFPKNTDVRVFGNDISQNKTKLDGFINDNQLANKSRSTYSSFTTNTDFKPDQAKHIKITTENSVTKDYAALLFVTRKDMIAIGNDLPEVNNDQVLMYTVQGNRDVKTMDWYGQELAVTKVSGKLKHLTNPYTVANAYIMVVKDDQELLNLTDLFNKNNVIKSNDGSTSSQTIIINTDTFLNLSEKNQGIVKAKESETIRISTETEIKQLMNGLTGGFLFIGFILGMTFILGAALIIYYKQLSEGAEDKRSYRILQEIGLTKKEVKRAINSQVLIVFFMPIIVSIIHFSAAFLMIEKLIKLFGVSNTSSIATVSLITIAIISVIYYLIYRKTSKIYYRIVER